MGALRLSGLSVLFGKVSTCQLVPIYIRYVYHITDKTFGYIRVVKILVNIVLDVAGTVIDIELCNFVPF